MPTPLIEVARAVVPTSATSAPRRIFRTDIQALRALAVTLVVANHVWHDGVPGGYVGVDVFFVISGFLITSHLVKELAADGRIRLGAFYARRARRLLPAALLVLLVTLVGVWFLLPYSEWRANALHSAAAALYGENWLLARQSVDYSALNDSATAVQHYWSLSVEEQFYLGWPLLMLAVAWAGRRLGKGLRGPLLVAVAVCTAGSLALSVVITAVDPSPAYFVTYARVWEFMLGAAVAVAGHRMLLGARTAGVVSTLGFAAIVVTAFAYGPATPFPGWLALVPAAATAAVIVAGLNPLARPWHEPVTASRPVQYVGDVSYSVYLWHWPIIVLLPWVIGRAPGLLDMVGVVLATLLLAALTKRFVEDPVRDWPVLRSGPRTLVATVAAMALVGGSALAVHGDVPRAEQQALAEAAARAAAIPAECYGPAALAPGADCDDPFAPAAVTIMGTANEYYPMPDECVPLDVLTNSTGNTTFECDFSSGAPTENVWLVGDSHAQQWQLAIVDLARERGWKLTQSYHGGCPPADVVLTAYRVPMSQDHLDRCDAWHDGLMDVIPESGATLVITSAYTRMETVDDGSGRSQTEQYTEGLHTFWREITAGGARVVVLADPPMNGDVRDPGCVAQNPADPLPCAVPRKKAAPEDPMAVAAQAWPGDDVQLVDLTDRFCDEATCYAVVGGVAVYFDADHLNAEYVRLLGPLVEAEAGL